MKIHCIGTPGPGRDVVDVDVAVFNIAQVCPETVGTVPPGCYIVPNSSSVLWHGIGQHVGKRLIMVANFLQTALRLLARNKIYACINILGLCVSLVCAMLIILYGIDEISFDRFHTNGGNIYRIVNQRVNPDGSIESTGGNSGYLQGPVFKGNIPEIQSFTFLKSNSLELKISDHIERRQVHIVSDNFFKTFSFPLIAGDGRTALAQPNSVVLSESMAQRSFGHTDVVGETLLIKRQDQFELFNITGVAKEAPDNSSIRFEVIIPVKIRSGEEAWFNYFQNTFITVQPGTDIGKLEEKMQAVYEREAADEIRVMAEKFNIKWKIVHRLQPLIRMHLSKDYPADNGLLHASSPTYSWILSSIAFMILLIASINFVNLTVARSLRRAKEIGIRKVVGSGRKLLILQFLFESFFACMVAFVLALVIAQVLLPSFNELSNKILSLSYLLNAKVLLIFAILLIVTVFLAGFYPSLIASSYNPVKALRGGISLKSGRLQKSLVVFQFALATILMTGTMLITRQFDYLTSQPLGYDDRNVIVVQNAGMKHREARLFKHELINGPGIVDVALKNGGREGTIAAVKGGREIEFDWETIDNRFLELYKIPITAGRNFSPEFPFDSATSVLVNETFVRQAGWPDPIGQEIDFFYEKKKYRVVGVVKDYHYLSLTRKIGPQLFTMNPAKDYGIVLIRIEPGQTERALAHIGATFRALFPLSAYVYSFKEDDNYTSYNSEARWKKIMTLSSFITIFVSCIGLFGLTVMTAMARTKEIGIRKVVGASVISAMALLIQDFLKIVVVATLIATPISWTLASKWLENYPYRIALGWDLFAVSGGIMLIIAIVTTSFQAVKTAMANPVDSLKNE